VTSRPTDVVAVATAAFESLRHGLATGDWARWFDVLADDVVIIFPQGRFKGRHHGKARAVEFFTMVRTVYRDGLFVDEVESVTSNASTVVFLFRDHGRMYLGDDVRDYQNRVAIALDVRDGQVSQYREYFGADGTWS